MTTILVLGAALVDFAEAVGRIRGEVVAKSWRLASVEPEGRRRRGRRLDSSHRQQKPSCTQLPGTHCALAQSCAPVHGCPLPPTAQCPLRQLALQHSPSFVQPLPKPHGEQTPPQSTSVSSPFCVQSAHVGSRPTSWQPVFGVAQRPIWQLPLEQSPSLPHVRSNPQRMQEPPQSTSDSSRFLIPSAQLTSPPPAPLPALLLTEVLVAPLDVDTPEVDEALELDGVSAPPAPPELPEPPAPLDAPELLVAPALSGSSQSWRPST
jgi:hypothetical protein